MKRFLTIFLFPFAIIYDIVTRFRNLLFDLGLFKTYEIPVFSIGVGNLSAGGTGKTPFISYLIQKFSKEHIAVLSRGYGRETKGFLEVKTSSSPKTVGDEIKMLFENHSKNAKFFVCENRKEGVQKILEKHPEINVILLDDAFQHRRVKPSLQVLLSRFDKPFFEDFLIPFGRLREARIGAKRADIIIFTKTKELTLEHEKYFSKGILPFKNNNVPLYFTRQSLLVPSNTSSETLKTGEKVKVLAALADNKLFLDEVSKEFDVVTKHLYPDHYSYNALELVELLESEPIITTEKDFIKIKNILTHEQLTSFYVQKLEIQFEKEENRFISTVKNEFKRFEEKKVH